MCHTLPYLCHHLPLARLDCRQLILYVLRLILLALCVPEHVLACSS